MEQSHKRGQGRSEVDFKREKELDKELIYLRDPVKMAENTIDLLRNDKNEKALELVRRASKHLPCTVSWNHLIDYEMSKGRIHKAVTIYNEMKKRAQKPDAKTYTIILRGLSWHPDMQASLPLALKIYHSMFADNCPVKPNIIHTNAVLKVCALTRDLDALWGVTAKLPPKGAGAPNNLTFTTILNAIRVIAWHEDKDLEDEDWEALNLRRQRAIIQGRRMWEEILPRWTAGDLFIDEELVCAMGRLLLLGSTERDNDDILSLVEQVMGLPRQKRRLGAPLEITDSEEPSPVSNGTMDAGRLDVDEAPQDESSQLEGHENHLGSHGEDGAAFPSVPVPVLDTALANVFRPLSKVSVSRPGQGRPGRNTLSLVLNACVNLRAIPSAQAYWGLLTDPEGSYSIVPDGENYHMYLRVLRVQRASHGAAELIKDMYSGDLRSMQLLQSKTFRIAFSTCIRNQLSPRAMEHATQILNIMYKAAPQPDLKALDMYRELAEFYVQQDFRITLNALRSLETGVRLLRNFINYGHEDFGNVNELTRMAATRFVQRMLVLYDKVSQFAGDRLEREEKNYMISQKSALRLWIGRKHNFIMEERDWNAQIAGWDARIARREARKGTDMDKKKTQSTREGESGIGMDKKKTRPMREGEKDIGMDKKKTRPTRKGENSIGMEKTTWVTKQVGSRARLEKRKTRMTREVGNTKTSGGKEPTNLVRRIMPKGSQKQARRLNALTEKGSGVGRRQGLQNARKLMERSGEFDGFV
ncbi:MAG: hypothetical protein Q9168_005250 [Polycauliona sp. 1 TL-2023]